MWHNERNKHKRKYDQKEQNMRCQEAIDLRIYMGLCLIHEKKEKRDMLGEKESN
jgi:hypothetical protein